MKILDILRGGTGKEFEIGRVWLSVGSLFGVTSPIGFEAYDVVWNHAHFDVAAWCIAYPGGLAALLTSGVLSIGAKEKAIAVARQTAALPPLDDKGKPDA